MVGLAQLVRASDCGPEGRWFEASIPPHKSRALFLKTILEYNNSRICSSKLDLRV